jgi:hypothetical protein
MSSAYRLWSGIDKIVWAGWGSSHFLLALGNTPGANRRLPRKAKKADEKARARQRRKAREASAVSIGAALPAGLA